MYSSPAATPRPASPQVDPGAMTQSQQVQGRLMQVKVLYTFDDDSKNNCLARCPQPLNIQTARLDPTTEIGVIELRTCIHAIVSASPELVAKLGKDYTVYAYDYSEYETPLVGQGMLSSVLATASSTPTAPAHASRTLVTGRVCRNVLGLFATGIKETLEVKLRLVPVPTCMQNEYLANLEKYRDSQRSPPENFDPGKWAAFLRENPGFGAQPPGTPPPTSDTQPTEPNPILGQFFEDNPYESQQMAELRETHQSIAHFPNSGPHQQRPLSRTNSFSNSRGSRPSTPSLQQNSQSFQQSRPSSRASNSGNLKRQPSSSSSIVDTQLPQNETSDEGPNRKRARLTKADWRGPSALSNNSESLRVTASAAASIRGHRLAATPGIAAEFENSDSSLRPPTPRPQGFKARNQPSLMRSITSIADDIVTHKSNALSPAYNSPAYTAEINESAVTSPEGYDQDSVGSTPADIPSSPPIMHRPSPVPSSPPLPEIPRHADSGYVGGSMDNFTDDYEHGLYVQSHKRRAYSTQSMNLPALPSEMSITEEMPGDPNLLPRSLSVHGQPAPPPKPIEHPPSSPKRAPKRRASQAKEPKSEPIPVAVPDPVTGLLKVPIPRHPQSSLPAQYNAQCSSLSNHDSSSNMEEKPVKSGTGSSKKRKEAIQKRLATSIKEGKMPPFCQNCGEISTPTWRKAFLKVETGSLDDFKVPENDDNFVLAEPVSRDENGKVTSYRIIRKTVGVEEREYEELQLCNSCGLWLFKCKSMRPQELWNKGQAKDSAAAKKKSKKSKKDLTAKSEPPTDGAEAPIATEPGSSTFFEQEGADPQWENHDLPTTGSQPVERSSSDSLPLPDKPRANSFAAPERASKLKALDPAAAIAALEKAIKSSPPRFPGSKFHPIDVEEDGSPQKTRRLLFPSPRKAGEIKSLEDGASIPANDGKGIGRTVDSPTNKENKPPAVFDDDDDEQNNKVDDEEGIEKEKCLRTPNAPTKTQVTPVGSKQMNKTPKGYLSSAARRWRSVLDTPTRGDVDPTLPTEQMTPFTAQLTQLISDANRSPSGGNNFFSDNLASDGGLFNFSDWGPSELGTDGLLQQSSPTLLPLSADPTADNDWIDQQMLDLGFDVFQQDVSLNHESYENQESAT